MLASAAVLLVLLAPGPTVELAYKAQPGVTYRDSSTAVSKLRLFSGARVVKYHIEVDRVLDRTVIDVDDDGKPVRERVVVVKFVKRTVASPTGEPGETPVAGHGRTFIWKGRRLYDESGDVTKKHRSLAEALSGWRDARLPEKPVAVGDSWKVSAADFLRAAGQRVPEGVEGESVFTLKAVTDGVARIAFAAKRSALIDGRRVSGTDEGVWTFDVAAGRDLKFEMKGTIVIGNRGGDGSLAMTRKVTRRE